MPSDCIDSCDIAIVGAGAAGLAASIFAAEAAGALGDVRIVLVESAKQIGAKILISGGGRCNVTHHEVHQQDFHGSQRLVRNILAAFPVQATIDWFGSMGVELKQEESGKLFPVSDKARTVLQALLSRTRDLGVEILTGHRVGEVVPSERDSRGPNAVGWFILHHQRGALRARRVILATGGRSLPRTGSDGYGWEIVRRLGHQVTPTYPALVPLVLEPHFFHAELSGLSQQVELTIWMNGRLRDRRSGSLLWTHFGISGPVVLDSSRMWTTATGSGAAMELRCNFWPGSTFEQVEARFLGDVAARPGLTIARLLGRWVPDRLGSALSRHFGLDPHKEAAEVSREQRRTLVHGLTGLRLPVEGDRGWNYAEVTAGGVPLEEINFRTMESRRRQGLYLVGEMLDCDGRIGGFNFQWAWATGRIVGRAAVQGLKAGDSATPR